MDIGVAIFLGCVYIAEGIMNTTSPITEKNFKVSALLTIVYLIYRFIITPIGGMLF